MIKKLLLMLFITLTFGCDNGIDRSLIKNREKLNSPNNEFTLYRYFIESSMAFGSGFTAIQILPVNKNCDYSDRNFLRFGNDQPFWIKWKSKDTILVKCLVQGAGLKEDQPFKKEVKKWNDWIIKIEYFSMYSSGLEGKFSCTNYSIDSSKIILNTKEKPLKFKINEVQISMDSNGIDLNHFENECFKSKYGLSFTSYNVIGHFKESDFIKQQVFIKVSY
jgi:hypothetical protein